MFNPPVVFCDILPQNNFLSDRNGSEHITLDKFVDVQMTLLIKRLYFSKAVF